MDISAQDRDHAPAKKVSKEKKGKKKKREPQEKCKGI